MTSTPTLPPVLPTVALTPEEIVTMADYQLVLQRLGLDRVLVCRSCGKVAEPGTGQVGWACACRMLVWRTM